MNFPDGTPLVIVIFAIALGVIQCFSGYRLFKFILGITGFLLGSAIAGSLVFEFSQNQVASLITGLIGGIIGSALMSRLYLFGVFITGAFLGAVSSLMALEMFHKDPIPVLIIIAAVVFGVAALVYQKIMIIAATAFSGAWYITTATIFILRLDAAEYIYPAALLWLITGTAGMITQFKVYRGTL